MNKSQRIRVNLERDAEQHIKVKLDQSVDTFEILSLNIDQKDIYQSFNSDYGVVIGRVNANQSVGVPNAKISVFIPISDEDIENEKIFSIYPYTNPRDKNNNGKRYNLLSRVGTKEDNTGLYKPKQPFGSFPTKEEFLTNETWLEVYEKYYKYTTVTNDSGDYMLFGVPIGVQTIHMSVDITDIGKFSMTPATMVNNLGYSQNLFIPENNLIKPQNDLDDLPNIETQEISVDVIPFWGDTDNFEIGITRQDFRIRAELVSSFTIFGNATTMGVNGLIGDPVNRESLGFYYLLDDQKSVDIRTLRNGDLDFRMFSYLPSINISDVDYDLYESTSMSDMRTSPLTDIYELGVNEYYKYNKDGLFIYNIPCNRKKIQTDEFGHEIEVGDGDVGIFTEFYGMSFLEYEKLPTNVGGGTFECDKNPNRPARSRLKIPQGQDNDNLFGLKYDYTDTNNQNDLMDSDRWRKNYFKFEVGSYYGVSQFYPTKHGNHYNWSDDFAQLNNLKDGVDYQTTAGLKFKTSGFNSLKGFDTDNDEEYNDKTSILQDNINYLDDNGNPIGADFDNDASTSFNYDFPYNAKTKSSRYNGGTNDYSYFFGAQWMNFFIILPQYSYALGGCSDRPLATNDLNVGRDAGDAQRKANNRQTIFVTGDQNRNMHVFANMFGTTHILYGKSNKSTFVKVDRSDLVKLNSTPNRGINVEDYNNGKTDDEKLDCSGLKYLKPNGNNNQEPYNFDVAAFDINYNNVDRPYIFKGNKTNDCVAKLFELNLI